MQFIKQWLQLTEIQSNIQLFTTCWPWCLSWRYIQGLNLLENSSFSIFLPSSHHFILKHFSTNLNEAFCARCRNELLSEINRTIIFVFNIGCYLNLEIDLDLILYSLSENIASCWSEGGLMVLYVVVVDGLMVLWEMKNGECSDLNCFDWESSHWNKLWTDGILRM